MLIAAGTIFIIGGTVSACKGHPQDAECSRDPPAIPSSRFMLVRTGRATLKEGATYTEEDERKDLTTVYIQTAVQGRKALCPPLPFSLVVALVACLAAIILCGRREAVAVAAYTAVS